MMLPEEKKRRRRGEDTTICPQILHFRVSSCYFGNGTLELYVVVKLDYTVVLSLFEFEQTPR
jgi:hypothetical protein